jgi:DNA-binding PadR family transcriptional regulator
MQQEVVLALLAKEPSQGYQLRARLDEALGPLGEGLNAGHIYVTLGRLEKTGMVALEEPPQGRIQRADRKVYYLTPAGQERVFQWLSEASWPRPDLAEFHLKLVAAAQAGLADPMNIVDAQRREMLSGLPWRSRTTPMQACCWRESCCDSRRTCAGWRPASGIGSVEGSGHDIDAAGAARLGSLQDFRLGGGAGACGGWR